MTVEGIEKRLENMILPDILSADHRNGLKASLLEQYSSLQAEGERNGLLSNLRFRMVQNKRLNKAGVLMVSVSLVIIVVIILSLQFTGVFSGVSGVLNKASAAMERVDSYRVIADAYNKSEYTNNEPVELSYFEAEYASTNQYHAILKYSSIDSEMIVIDNQVYVKGDTVTPQTSEQIIKNLPSKEKSLDDLDLLTDIEILEDEIVDYVLCFHYRGILDVEKYLEKTLPKMEEYFTELYTPMADLLDEQYKDRKEKPVLPSLEDSVKEGLESYEEYTRKYKTVIDYWISKEDYLIRQVKSVRRPVSDPLELNEEMITAENYYDFNEEIIINPPLTETGELKEGWYELSMENFEGLE